MINRKIVIFLIDLVILMLSFLLAVMFKPVSVNYLTPGYLGAFSILLIVWSATSFYFEKYNIKKSNSLGKVVRTISMSNFFTLGMILALITLLWISGFSRLVLFGTFGIATLIEILTGSIYYSLISTPTINGHSVINPPVKKSELKNARKGRDFRQFTLDSEVVKHAVNQECGKGIYSFMCRFLDNKCKKNLMVSTSSRFNIEIQPENFYNGVVNMKRVNDIRYINKFFESVNRKIPEGGTFIGCAETKDQRKLRILRKYPPVLNWGFYLLDYILKRVFPKFSLTYRIYYFLTRGNNRVISRAELLGRLYSCGFTLVADEVINGIYCFCVRKEKDPVYDFDPTYGMFIKLRRVGMKGKIIRVYKFRTMHPYAEYLQNYVFENNNLDSGGKFRNDFRITSVGRIIRTLWIDELPMLFNLLKGEVKLIGVRPLSQSYYDLYNEALRQERIKYKPGLIPPFYADMPKTLEEIQASEMRYLEEYSRKPLLTDIKYFRMAVWNIVFKRARSK